MDEHRTYPRFPAHWEIEVYSDSGQDRQVFQGNTTDLSRGGASVYGSHELPSRGPFSVRLALPTTRTRTPQDTLQIQAYMAYAVQSDSRYIPAVRMGLCFLQMEDADKRLLEKRLQEHFERRLTQM